MATIEQRIYDGNRAREVLDNEVFLAVFDDIQKEVIEQWTNSPARDQEGREKLWQYLMLLRKVKTHLQTTLDTGKLANIEVNERESALSRMTGGWLS